MKTLLAKTLLAVKNSFAQPLTSGTLLILIVSGVLPGCATEPG